METKQIKISEYNYALPDGRIAKYPLSQRDHSKLLVYRSGEVGEDTFVHLPDYFSPGELMVFNNTKVIQARLHFRKETGALIEIFLLEPALPADYEQMFQTRGKCSWYCLVGNLKKWKEGTLTRTFSLPVSSKHPSANQATDHSTLTVKATRGHLHGTTHRVDFEWVLRLSPNESLETPSFAEVIDTIGELPIPPYLNREAEDSDKTTYQTVYSKIKGSVAAPTAGLHFTDEVLAALDNLGVDREEVTLHVGAGTFKPVKSAEIEGHEMHTEFISVKRQTVEKLLRHQCSATAVGTTSVRTLESLYWMGCKLLANPALTEEQMHVHQWEPYEVNGVLASVPAALQALLRWYDSNHVSVLNSSTQIIIAPGYEYKIVKKLITNFHQPQSTLLLLVSAFVNGDWRKIYDYALTHDFRFLSYGDSSLLMP